MLLSRDLKQLADVGGDSALATAFQLLDAFRILAAVRKGPFGVEQLNELMRHLTGLTADYAPGLPLIMLETIRQPDSATATSASSGTPPAIPAASRSASPAGRTDSIRSSCRNMSASSP
ncbi:MAG: hypothetical protein L6W00_19540 [Lentisphaeria bacterium]|nr:MAG: hypothetical protein L6W00_19540 [Lentisphaeria bacterium]